MPERRYGPRQPERGIHDEPDPEIVEILDEFMGSGGIRFPEIDDALAAEREKQQGHRGIEDPEGPDLPASMPPQNEPPHHK